MSSYLSYTFNDDAQFISTFDELPLWSASFGLLLLKHLPLRAGQTVVDIGSGAGFPLMELAGRMGSSCRLIGIDPWENAVMRARQKIANYGLGNVELIQASAATIPLPDNSVDLIVSNLGINNFSAPDVVFRECYRILKPGGKLALTTNLYGHWKEFYAIFYATLQQLGKGDLVNILKKDEEHRGTIAGITNMFTNSGLSVTRCFDETLEMKFLDGSAFLNHYFVKLGWLTTWLGFFPKEQHEEIFAALEENLNRHARLSDGLLLTVPMAYIEGEKG